MQLVKKRSYYTTWQSVTTLAGVLMRGRRGRLTNKVRKKSHVRREAEIREAAASWGVLRTASNPWELQAATD